MDHGFLILLVVDQNRLATTHTICLGALVCFNSVQESQRLRLSVVNLLGMQVVGSYFVSHLDVKDVFKLVQWLELVIMVLKVKVHHPFLVFKDLRLPLV